MQLRYKFELRCQLDRLRHSLDSVKILFWLGVGGWLGGKIIPRIRLTSAKDLVEVETELGNIDKQYHVIQKCNPPIYVVYGSGNG